MTKSPRILLTGANGQVGWELCRTLACLGEVIALEAGDMDLADVDVIRRVVRERAPQIIVNSAAYTAVDQAESEPELAHAINAAAPGILADEAQRLGAMLVHFSTDYVFDGSGETAWREDDAPGPINVYGMSKLAGERAVRSGCERHLIFRTSWVYGGRGANFLLTMRRLMRQRPELKIVADQIGAPTWSRMLAEATAQIIMQQIRAGTDGRPAPWGLYHMSNAGETSWHGFAQAILALDPPNQPASLLPIPSSEYPTPARRPLNSRLDNNRLAETFDVRLPHWRDALALCLAS